MDERVRTRRSLPPGICVGWKEAEIVEKAEAAAQRQWGRKLLDAIDRMGSHSPKLAPPTQKRTLTVEEAAAQLGIGRTVCFGLVASGALRSLKVGRRRLIPAEAVDEFLESGRAENQPVQQIL